jgi:hypothetical protein
VSWKSVEGSMAPRCILCRLLSFYLGSIEHLPEQELSRFAPSILGVYRPRILLVSTPNYSFNAKFGAQKMYVDPTNRTDRLFRHDDHKFE